MESIIPTGSLSSSDLRPDTERPDTKRDDVVTGAASTSSSHQKINREKIVAALNMDAGCLGICPAFQKIKPRFDLHLLESVPSTNAYVWDLLASGAGAGTVVIAQQQSRGRGQHGRSWVSEPGGLYLSLALEPDWPLELSAQLTCLSAWGIATAFNNLGISIEVKWPNDLFFRGKKLGGILTETKLSHPAASHNTDENHLKPAPYIKQAVIGVGINWHNCVPQTGVSLSTILEEEAYQTVKNKINCLEVLIALVLRGILQGYYFYQQVGSQVFMKAYQNLLTQVGNLVSIGNDPLTRQRSIVGFVDQSVVNGFAMRSQTELTHSSLKDRSGKVVGISEEGYLQVALSKVSANETASEKSSSDESSLNSASPEGNIARKQKTKDAIAPESDCEEIYLIKPGEIHIR